MVRRSSSIHIKPRGHRMVMLCACSQALCKLLSRGFDSEIANRRGISPLASRFALIVWFNLLQEIRSSERTISDQLKVNEEWKRGVVWFRQPAVRRLGNGNNKRVLSTIRLDESLLR